LSEKNSATYFFLFHTIHDVLKAESALKSQGSLFELVPVPRTLSSDCGVCITSGRQPDNIIRLFFSLNLDRCFFFNGKEFVQMDTDGLISSHKNEAKE
jgi:Protein of unknown function (DUF3343)